MTKQLNNLAKLRNNQDLLYKEMTSPNKKNKSWLKIFRNKKQKDWRKKKIQ